MLTAIQLREEDNTILLDLPIGKSRTPQPYYVRRAEGLDPVSANISVSPFSNLDGGIYQSSRVDSRNIVLTIGIRPNHRRGEGTRELREGLYNFFAPKSPANMVFVNDNGKLVRIRGYVESFETDMFSKDTSVQVSLICPEPYFVGYNLVTISGLTGAPMDVSSFGSAPAGFTFDMTLTQNAASIHIEAGFEEPLLFKGDLKAGDRLRISTVSGNKYILKTRAGVTTSELDGIASGTMSMTVDSRTPTFYVNRLTASDSGAPFTITHLPNYVGI